MDFYIDPQMSVTFSPHFTAVENALPKIESLEQEELMISTEGLKSAVTFLGIIHFITQKTISKPNESSYSQGGTSDEVLKKKKPQPT